MRCAACGALGGEGARFCAECGAALGRQIDGQPHGQPHTQTHPDLPPLTPLVNRERDLSPLLDRWAAAKSGAGQTVLISGEPGIGKTRLVRELGAAAAAEPHTWLECASSAYTQDSAFRPVIHIAEQALGFREDDDPEARLQRIHTGVAALQLEGDDAAPLLAALLNVPTTPEPAPTSPAQQRRRTLDLFVELTLALAARKPLIVLAEDLQWTDPSSLELFERLIERGVRSPMLLVGTARPEFDPGWRDSPTLTRIQLGPLAADEVATLVRQLSASARLPEAVVDHVAGATDGIPLFAEEMTKTLLRSDWLRDRDRDIDLESALDPLAIPATLYDSLMARLDRISRRRPAAKRVAQRAAVIGPEFDEALAAQVVGLDADVVRHGLARLVEDDLLVRRGDPSRAVYAFRHALIHDAAYRSLLKLQRRELHARTAEALAQRRADDETAAAPEVIARHYEAAGRNAEAVPLYHEAADEAARQSAHHEAIAHLERAIGLIAELPDNRSWQAAEAELQTALGSSLIAIRGYGDPGIEHAYKRANSLYDQLGDKRQVGYALAGLSLFYFNHGEVDRGARLARDSLQIARRINDEALRVLASVQVAVPTFYQANFASALEHLDAVTAIYDAERHRWLGYRYGADQGVAAHCFAALSLMRLGRPDTALERARAAVELAHLLSDPYDIAYALFFETAVHWNRGDVAAQEATATRVLGVAEEHQFELFVGLARMFRAAARVFATGDAGALTDLYEGSGIAAGTGFRGGLPAFVCLVAEAQQHAGLPDQAVGTVEAALSAAAETGQPYWDAELHRLKGELQLALGDAEEGEQQLKRAIDIARSQHAAWPELRGALALARLLADRGQQTDARDLLAPVYERFEEGASTRELREAAEFLERDPAPQP